MKISKEDRAMINYMKNSFSKGLTVQKSLENFANMYGDTFKRAHARWYQANNNREEGYSQLSLREIHLKEGGLTGFELRAQRRRKNNTNNYTQTKEVAEKSFAHTPKMSQSEIYDKIDIMHSEMVKYIGNIESSMEREIKTAVDTIKIVCESTLKQAIVVPQTATIPHESKYQISKGGEIRAIGAPKERSFSEKKVNMLIHDLDKAEDLNKRNKRAIDSLKSDRLLLETEIEELSQKNSDLENELRENINNSSLAMEECKNKVLELEKLVSDLNSTVDKQRETIAELSNRGVVERLFNKKKS